MAKYGRTAAKTVASAMRRRKSGTLRSGSGRTVTDPKQAIAIGLSEAREKGGKVPPEPDARASGRRSSRKTGAKKTGRPARTTAKRRAKKKTSSRKTTSTRARRAGAKSR